MSSEYPLTYWIARLKEGDRDEATRRICEAYFSRVIGVARARLAGLPRLQNDAEDVAISVLDTFFRRAAAGRFPRLTDQNDLWSLLLTITCCKAARRVTRDRGAKVTVFSELAGANPQRSVEQVEAPDADPAEAAALAEGVSRLLGALTESLRTVALLALDGYTNEEIGQRVGLSVGSIGRKLKLIREIWNAEFPDIAAE
jgi:DNA-directed RNA polymerase specialized sigma24 family protein